jgi:hypothetical protein
MDQSTVTQQDQAAVVSSKAPTCSSTLPECQTNLSPCTGTMTTPGVAQTSSKRSRSPIHPAIINTSMDHSTFWSDPNPTDIWRQYSTETESATSSSVTQKDGRWHALEPTWKLTRQKQQHQATTDFGSSTYHSSDTLSTSISEANEGIRYGTSSGGNMRSSYLNAMPNYASTCGAMSEPTNGLWIADSEWSNSYDAFNNQRDGPMSGHTPLEQDGHLSHLDLHHQERHHQPTSPLVQPTISIWKDIPIPMPMTTEEEMSHSQEILKMMQSPSDPTNPGQTQPTALETIMMMIMRDLKMMSAASLTTTKTTQSTFQEHTSQTMMIQDTMSTKSRLSGEWIIPDQLDQITSYQFLQQLTNGALTTYLQDSEMWTNYGPGTEERKSDLGRRRMSESMGTELDWSSSMMMTTEAEPLQTMTEAVPTTEMIQQQFQDQTNGSNSGSKELQSQILPWNFHEYSEGEVSTDLLSVEGEGEAEVVEGVDRYGDESRWDEFRSREENYEYEIERNVVVQEKSRRVGAIERGLKRELVDRMKRDSKMMKGKRFDQKLVYYWGKEIVTKPNVSKLAYRTFGKHWRLISIRMYQLYRGLEDELETEDIAPWTLWKTKHSDIEAENKKRRALKALKQRK